MAVPLTLQILIDARKAEEGARRVKREVRELGTKDMPKAAREADRLDKGLDRVGKDARRAGTEVERSGKQMRGMGAAAGVATRAVRGLVAGFTAYATIRRTISTISEFETSIAQLRGVTGASGASLQNLVDTARTAGATTRYTASEAAQGLLELSRAGLDVKSSTEALRPSLDLATAGMLSLAESADLVTNVAAQFRLPASQIQRIGDVLVAVSNKANTNVAQLGQGLKDVGVVASNVGINLEDTVAALGVLANRGLKGSDGAIKLRQAFLQLLDPSAGAVKTLQNMGLTLEDVNIQSQGLEGVLQSLAQAQLDIVQATQLVGTRNAAALVALVQSVQEYKSLGEAARNAEGEMRKLSDALDNTISGSFKSLNSAIDELLLKSGDGGLVGAIRGILDASTGMLRGLSNVETAMVNVETSLDGTTARIREQGEELDRTVSKWQKFWTLFGVGGPQLAVAGMMAGAGLPPGFQQQYSEPIGPLNRGPHERRYGAYPPNAGNVGEAIRTGLSDSDIDYLFRSMGYPGFNRTTTRATPPLPPAYDYNFRFSRGRYSMSDYSTPTGVMGRGVGYGLTGTNRLTPFADIDESGRDVGQNARMATFAVDAFATSLGRLGAELASGTADMRELGRLLVQSLTQGIAQEAFSNFGRQVATGVVHGLSTRQQREGKMAWGYADGGG